ncbi:MAG: hypothetical protein ABIW84_08450 [Ilumatobacteraceae bacterium]
MEAEPAVEQIASGETVWRFDRAFLTSNWTCIWGRGCHGIDTEKRADRGLGCCSVGAEIESIDEAMLVAASAAALSPDRFQYHHVASAEGVFSDDARSNTRVVDGACVFLNRPGFAGGAGCALHLAAVAVDESPLDWKPSVCWQLPIKVEWEVGDDQIEVATVRAWRRDDWGEDGATMAWCCTERGDGDGDGEAYAGDRRVIDSLAEELEAIVGTPVFIELRRRLAQAP